MLPLDWPFDLGLDLARPWMLAGLALLPLYAWRRVVLAGRDRVPYAPLRWTAVRGWRRRAASALLAVELLLVATVCLALAGPHRVTTTERVDDAGIDLALVLDVSLSMLAEDFEPNRMAALRRIARDFLTRRSADRVALVIFAADTYVQSPLTTDDLVLLELLSGVTIDMVDQYLSGGTAIGDALLVASDQLLQARVEGRDQSVILITDGESNQGIDPGIAARYLHEQDIRFHVIGVGGPEPLPVFRDGRRIGDDFLTRLDEEALLEVSRIGGGSYYRAADTAGLEEVFAALSRLASSPLEATTLEHRESLVPWLALVALALFVLYVSLAGGVVRRPLR